MLEHLEVLDFEGNNVSTQEQLFYLTRLSQLTDVNFKHNPVASTADYYQIIQRTCPLLEVLDDEEII